MRLWLAITCLSLFGVSPHGCSLHEAGRPELAVGTNPISLYVVNNGKLEERRSGIAPAWSPDGERLAYGGDHDGNVWVDDRSYSVGEITGDRLEWTPDGQSLLLDRGGIRLLDTNTGAERLVTPGTLPALSPDGRTVAYLRYSGDRRIGRSGASTLQVAPLAGGKPLVLARTTGPPTGPHFASRPQWFPGGSAVAVARRNPREDTWAVERVGLDGSRRVVVPRIGEEFALSPDGRLIAYQLSKYRKGLVVARPGERGKVYEVGKLVPKGAAFGLGTFGGLAWSPDGREVAFCLGSNIDAASTILRLYALNVTTGKTRVLTDIADAADAELAWNPEP